MLTGGIIHYRNIDLEADYTATDTNAISISKDSFLTKLLSGNYIPVKISSQNLSPEYKLYGIPKDADTSIKTTIIQSANTALYYYKMEGKNFPDFNFKDLDGNVYTNKNLMGKIIVIKCWFIHCATCVAEMPLVNKIANSYKKNPDVVFISFAYDSETELRSFLMKTTFKYAVISVPETYIENTLGVFEYPTQIIINKQGNIVKVIDDAKDLKPVLQKEISKSS